MRAAQVMRAPPRHGTQACIRSSNCAVLSSEKQQRRGGGAAHARRAAHPAAAGELAGLKRVALEKVEAAPHRRDVTRNAATRAPRASSPRGTGAVARGAPDRRAGLGSGAAGWAVYRLSKLSKLARHRLRVLLLHARRAI